MGHPDDTTGHSFLPEGTMFKLSPPRPGETRQLECVACGAKVNWRVYTVASKEFDARCSTCGVKAVDYWKDKPHREIDDGEDKDEEAGDRGASPS